MSADNVRRRVTVSGQWQLVAAGAMTGIAAAGLMVSVVTHLNRAAGWHVQGHEPAAAFLGALGIWFFGAGGSVGRGLLGVVAALLAMLLGDLFAVMALMPLPDWGGAPAQLLTLFRWHHWPKLVRYAFGMYLAWYICSAGRAAAELGVSDER